MIGDHENVVYLDDHRQHMTLPCAEDHVHVFPVAMIENFILGKAVEMPPCLLRRIVGLWLLEREGWQA